LFNPLYSSWNKFLIKFDISILSSSITKTELDIPNNAKFFSNSHPKVSAPARNIFKFLIFPKIFLLKTEIISSYLDLFSSFLSYFSDSGIIEEYCKNQKFPIDL